MTSPTSPKKRNQKRLLLIGDKMELETVWPAIETGLRKIYDIDEQLTFSEYMKFYTAVYDYCLKGLHGNRGGSGNPTTSVSGSANATATANANANSNANSNVNTNTNANVTITVNSVSDGGNVASEAASQYGGPDANLNGNQEAASEATPNGSSETNRSIVPDTIAGTIEETITDAISEAITEASPNVDSNNNLEANPNASTHSARHESSNEVTDSIINTISNTATNTTTNTIANSETNAVTNASSSVYTVGPLASKPGSIALQFRKTYPSVSENTNIITMYNRVDEYLKDYTKNLLIRMKTNIDDSLIPSIVSNQWTAFKVATTTISGIFDYMNRIIVIQKQKGIFDDEFHPINRLAMIHWRDNILLKLNDNVLPSLISFIQDDRVGKTVDRAMLRNIIGCYVELSFNEKTQLYNRSPYQATSDNSVRSMSQSSSFFTSIGTNTSYSNNRIISDDWEQSVYRRYFEFRFLNETQMFYKKESKVLLMSCGFSNYIQYVKKRLQEEMDRILQAGEAASAADNPETVGYVHESSAVPLKTVCMGALIEDHIQTIKEETKNILKNENYQDLKAVYELLRQTPVCLDELRNLISKQIEKNGKEAIFLACNQPSNDEVLPEGESNAKEILSCGSSNSNVMFKNKSFDSCEEQPCCSHAPIDGSSAPNVTKYSIDPVTFVETVIRIYEKYDNLIKVYLNSDNKFVNALQIGCVNFIKNNAVTQNPDKFKPVKMVANYYNRLLRQSNIFENDNEHEEKIKKAFIVFQLIEDKDLFQKYYIEHLATRLLSHEQRNLDIEKIVINRFKEICGIEYTSQMQRMVRDMESSTDMNAQFRFYMNEVGMSLNMDFCVNILSFGSWPLRKETECILPSELSDLIEQVENFYFSKYSGRKLVWLYLTSRVTIATQGFSETYYIKTNIVQAIILLHFNKYQSITFQQLCEITHIPENILLHVLENFCNAKILTCKNAEELSSPGAQFEIDESFYSKKKTINIYSKHIRAEEPKADPQPKHIKDERRYVLEAAIVRIMKARVRLSHVDLLEEVMTQLSTRFRPQIKLIKSCIENLLDKEYLAREDGDGNFYVYLA